MKKIQGFTLIELLVTAALVATVGLVATGSFLNVMQATVKTETIKEVKQSGDFALSSIARVIHSASDITSTCDGATTSTLTVLDTRGNSITYSCGFDGGAVRIASTSASTTGFLTSDKVTLGISCPGSLAFTCTSSSDGYKAIVISYVLRQKSAGVPSNEQASISFRTTATLRNSGIPEPTSVPISPGAGFPTPLPSFKPSLRPRPSRPPP